MVNIAFERPNSFYDNVRCAFEGIDFEVNFIEATEASLLSSYVDDAYCMFHRSRPWHDNALEARPAPFGPFWAIDKTADPAQKHIFKAKFEPEKINSDNATAFFKKQLNRDVFKVDERFEEAGFVFVALQGVLDKRRFWQSMSPLEMVDTTLKVEKNRPIYVKLHPNETYTQKEIGELNGLMDQDRVRIVDGDLHMFISACDYTVSMNSSASFKAMLFKKPGILFGDADFHHPLKSIRQIGVRECFQTVLNTPVDYEKYVLWYLRRQMIHNFLPRVQHDILQQCKKMGWKLGA